MSRQYRDICIVVRGADTYGTHASRSADVQGADIRGAAPVRFRWRYRTYHVRELLGFWIESGPWWMHWRTSRHPARTSPSPGQADQHRVAPPSGAFPIERQVWRVSATTNCATGSSGVYDLVHEPGSDTWWLDRVWD